MVRAILRCLGGLFRFGSRASRFRQSLRVGRRRGEIAAFIREQHVGLDRMSAHFSDVFLHVRDHLAVFVDDRELRVDECMVGDEVSIPDPGV